MTALGPCNHSIRSHHYIAVKVDIHLQSSENYKIKLIYHCTLVKWIGVFSRADPIVPQILHRLHRIQIKVLGVQSTLVMEIWAGKFGKGTRQSVMATTLLAWYASAIA